MFRLRNHADRVTNQCCRHFGNVSRLEAAPYGLLADPSVFTHAIRLVPYLLSSAGPQIQLAASSAVHFTCRLFIVMQDGEPGNGALRSAFRAKDASLSGFISPSDWVLTLRETGLNTTMTRQVSAPHH